MISATSCYSSELLLDSFICPSVIRVPLVPLLASIQTICERILPRQQTNSLWKAEVTATLRITYQVSRKGWSCVSGTWSEVCGSCLNIVALKVSKSTMPQESSVLAGIWRWGSPEKKKKKAKEHMLDSRHCQRCPEPWNCSLGEAKPCLSVLITMRTTAPNSVSAMLPPGKWHCLPHKWRYSWMKLGECWEINSSVLSLCCLPADHHGAAGQCTVGTLTRFPCWSMLKHGSVVWPQLSQQWLRLVCTLLLQKGLQIS